MGFNNSAVTELRIRLNLDQKELASLLSKYAKVNNIKSRCSGKSIVSRLESGKIKMSGNRADLLYMIDQDTNNKDLIFYVPPKHYKTPN